MPRTWRRCSIDMGFCVGKEGEWHPLLGASFMGCDAWPTRVQPILH